LEQIERSIGTIGRVGSSVLAARRRSLQVGVDVSAPGMGILGVLERGGPLHVSVIARRAGMVPTLASRELRSLEAAGYIVRRPDDDDGRVVVVTLTPNGKEVYGNLRRASVAATADALAGWTAPDLAVLARLLARMADDFSAVRR